VATEGPAAFVVYEEAPSAHPIRLDGESILTTITIVNNAEQREHHGEGPFVRCLVFTGHQQDEISALYIKCEAAFSDGRCVFSCGDLV
jgi:hypothetical protein